MIDESPLFRAVKSIVAAMPSGYLVAWFIGIPVEKWAAFFAMVWSIWLIVDKLIAKIKHRRTINRVRREDAARAAHQVEIQRSLESHVRK